MKNLFLMKNCTLTTHGKWEKLHEDSTKNPIVQTSRIFKVFIFALILINIGNMDLNFDTVFLYVTYYSYFTKVHTCFVVSDVNV